MKKSLFFDLLSPTYQNKLGEVKVIEEVCIMFTTSE